MIENEENKPDNEKDKEDSVLKDKVIEPHDGQDKEEEKKRDVMEKNDGVLSDRNKVIEPCDGQDKEEEEEKKHDVTEKEAHVESDGLQPQVEWQISAQQFYKRTQTLLRAVRKQQEEQDQVSGKQSPDECTVKIGRRSVCITDKVTENRSEIRQVYSCRLALQFKS